MIVPTTQDLNNPETFIRSIFRDQTGRLAVFSGYRAENGKLDNPTNQFFPYPANLAAAVDVIHSENADGKEVYVGSTLYTANSRTKPYAAPMTALYADLDGARVPDHFPPPSVLVESSPDRQQAWWLLEAPMSPDDGENLNKRLTYALGADKGGWDLSQVLRIPGTRNHKYDSAHARVLDAEPFHVYTADDLAFLPPVPTAVDAGPIEPMPDDWGDGAAVRARHRGKLSRGLLDRLDTPQGDRSINLFGVYRLCKTAGLDRDETFALVHGTRADKFGQDSRPARDLWQDVCRFFARTASDDMPIDPLAPDYVPRFEGYRRSDLRTIPPARFLVDGFLLDNAITGISGKEGTSKSLLAQSLSCCLVTGSPWYGHAVKRQGPVVYIAAEGAEGINKRVRAWELTNDVTVGDDLIVIGQGPDFQQDGDVSDLLADVKHFLQGRPPVLIVADTFAQTNGGEENSNSDGATYVRACDRMRRETGAAMLFLAHDSDGGKAFRGASSVRGNIHATVHVTTEAGIITAQGKKLKDFGLPADFRFQQVIVRDADDSPFLEDGDDRSSVVLEPVSGIAAGIRSLNNSAAKALQVLRASGTPLTRAAWKRAAQAAGMSDGGFNAAFRNLTESATGGPTVQSDREGKGAQWSPIVSDGAAAACTDQPKKSA